VGTVLRLLGYMLDYKGELALILALTVTSNAFALAFPAISGYAIDLMVGVGNVDFPRVIAAGVAMILCYIVFAFLSYVLSVRMINLSRKIVYRMRTELFDRLLDLPVGYFDRTQTGDIISRLSYDIDTINASLSNDLVQICASAVTVLGSLVMMFTVSPILISVFAVSVPALIFFTVYRIKKVKPLFRARSKKLGELNGYAEEMLSGGKTIAAYGKEKEMIERFGCYNEAAVNAYYEADYQGSVVGPSVNFINNLSLSLISMFGAFLLMRGTLTPGGLSSFILYSRKFSGPISESANIISEIQSAASAAERVFRVLDELPERRDGEDRDILCEAGASIRFENVSFGYTEEKEVLHGISFEAEAGKRIAIVGPTGSGKTTVINLLMRFYDADGGRILINGVDSSTLTLGRVRSMFTMVLQESWLFEGSVADNIAYSKKGASREEIEAAAKAANAHEFIMGLPNGYDTPVSDGALNLSKGQKQLLTIARAMLSQSPILILDEATSNVDSRTEAIMQKAMENVMRGKTSLVVAHRLSTVRDADLILVLKDGQIIERGTHESLLSDGGFYASLYNSQFK